MVWLCPDLVCPDLVCIRKLSCHFGWENENEPWDFGVPSFQTHPSATLFLQWKHISGGNIVVGAGNICDVPPRNPRNCRCFTTPGTDRMPTSRTSPRRGSSCRRTVCRSSGMPCESAVSRNGPLSSSVGVWKGELPWDLKRSRVRTNWGISFPQDVSKVFKRIIVYYMICLYVYKYILYAKLQSLQVQMLVS